MKVQMAVCFCDFVVLLILFYYNPEWYDFVNGTFFYIRSMFLQLLSHNLGLIIFIARLVTRCLKMTKHISALNDHHT